MVLISCLLFSLVVVSAKNVYENDDISIELLSNTDQCLINCEAELRLCSKSGTQYFNKDNFQLWFVDNALDLKPQFDYKLEKKNVVGYEIDVPIYNYQEVCDNETNNVTLKSVQSCRMEKYLVEVKKEDKQRIEYNSYDPSKSVGLYSISGCVDFKISGQKELEEAVDWRINIMGIEPDWAWWNNSWNYKREIVIDSSKIDSALTNFTTLVHLNSTNFDFGKAQNDLDDIRFLNASENEEYDYELENYTTTDAWFWVRIPYVPSTVNTSFYIYYNNSGAVNSEDSANTWDDSAEMVHHFDQVANAHQEDSTGNNNDLTPNAVDLGDWVSTPLGAGVDLDGSAEYYNGSFDGANGTTQRSVLMWVNVEAPFSTEQFIYDIDTATLDAFRIISGYLRYYDTSNNAGDFDVRFDMSGAGMSNNKWYMLTGTSTATSSRQVYLNSTQQATESTGSYTSTNAETTVGRRGGADDDLEFNGTITEMRYYNIELTADFIEACYYSESENLLTFGAEEDNLDTIAPTWRNIFEGTSDPTTYSDPQNYGFQINFTDNTGMDMVFFEHNATGTATNYTTTNTSIDIYYANITSFPVTVIGYKFYGNDTFDNWNTSDVGTFTVSQATQTVNLLLNGTDGNVDYTNGKYANFTGTSEINLNMTTNITGFVDQLNKPSPYENITQINCTERTVFNITIWSLANENYTSGSETHYAICSVSLAPGNYTDKYCSADDLYLVNNVTDLGGTSSYEYIKCEYNCTETLTGTRCDYSPSVKAGLWVGIILTILGAFYLVYKILWGLFK